VAVSLRRARRSGQRVDEPREARTRATVPSSCWGAEPEPHVDLELARNLVKLGNAAQYASTMPETRRASRPRDLERLRIGRGPSDAFVRMKRRTLRGAIGVRRRRAYRGHDAKGGRDSHHARDPAHQLAAPHAVAGWRNRVEVQKDAIASGCVKVWTLRLRKKSNGRFVTRKELLCEIRGFKRRRSGAHHGRVTAGRSGLATATLGASPFHGRAPDMVWNQPRENDHRRLARERVERTRRFPAVAFSRWLRTGRDDDAREIDCLAVQRRRHRARGAGHHHDVFRGWL
jgi:hypothetical protein